jgi:membrane-associated protease RseP (regulator of RpoE activity)
MKSGTAWWLVLGLFLSAGLMPPAMAQKEDQQNNSGNFDAQKSQDSDAVSFNANSGIQNSKESASKQPAGQSGNDQSSKQGDKTQQQNWRASEDQQNSTVWWQNPSWQDKDKQAAGWNHILFNDGQIWGSGIGTHPELYLAAAEDSVRQHLNLPGNQGVVVLGVAPNSGAAQAGIQQNDILLTLGDEPLAKPDDLYDQLKKVGEKPVPLAILRAGSRVTLQVQPVIRVALRPAASRVNPSEYWIGVSVTAIEPVLRAQLRLSQNRGVIVNEVYPDSPAAKAGISLHDIIVSVEGIPITEPGQLAKSVQSKGSKPLSLSLTTKGGQPRSLTVTPERKKTNETSQVSKAPRRSLSYDFVRPGAVLDDTTGLAKYYYQLQPGQPDANAPLQTWHRYAIQTPQDGDATLNKRLDALDSELKELRKLVAELQKSASAIIERQKSTSDATPKD